MKVFISWSGNRSKLLANALREWLPYVLQYTKPWVSDKDIGAGDRWAQSIAGELETSNFGIICITPENLQSQWVLFEAGALSKSMLDAKVIPLLFGLELSDLSGPLSQFQAQKVDEDGILAVVRAINSVGEEKTADDIVAGLVPQLWPSLKAKLANIPDTKPTEKHMRPQHEILEELVTGVRGLNSRMREFDPETEERAHFYRNKRIRFNPRIFKELAFMSNEMGDASTVLLLLAGYLKEDFPWLTELFSESYREIRDGGPATAELVFRRLHRTVRHTMHSGMMREMMGSSKDANLMINELPMFLDIALHDMIERNKSIPFDKDDGGGDSGP